MTEPPRPPCDCPDWRVCCQTRRHVHGHLWGLYQARPEYRALWEAQARALPPLPGCEGAAPPPPPDVPPPWPAPARALARLRRPGEAGLGDTAARLLRRAGAGRLARLYERLTGRPCGCADRQAALNATYPYPPPGERGRL